ncbi:MAG: RidA family protein [Proteobacteria bacterium]|nr:RidA family protein [Pseudomonadota bacterium]
MHSHLSFHTPATMGPARGYSHVVETKAPSRTVYVAGQLGMHADGRFAGEPGDFRAQALQAFENLKIALAEVGADFGHVVKVTSYFINIARDLPTYFEVRDRYVNRAAAPASTAVEITRLAREGALYEIEAIAVLQAGRARANTAKARVTRKTLARKSGNPVRAKSKAKGARGGKR